MPNISRFLFLIVVLAAAPCRADWLVTGGAVIPGLGTVASPNILYSFSCVGAPTCSGTYTVTLQFDAHPPGCPNAFSASFSGSLVVTGLSLSQVGPMQGSFTQTGKPNPSADGCSFGAPFFSQTRQYTSAWPGGTTGTGAIAFNNGGAPWSFTATSLPAPPFPMTVNSSVTPTLANAAAQIQPAAQDLGATASVFVFAHSPASRLAKALKDGADPCVLAQLNPNGQLVPVSASTMQPYTTGILTAQGQTVTVLNNVPTPGIAGATFYVGYGTSATAMLNRGNYQGVVTISGPTQCTATISAAAAPNSPGALTGLWWNAAESGWGIHFTQRGNNVFAAWYTYDAAGKPKWYVATCAGISGTAGTCTGTLYQVAGPGYFGIVFNPGLVTASSAGTLEVAFSSADTASMRYTVAGQTRTVALTRQPLATGTTPPAVDYSDLWWNPTESGWGMAMSQQYGITFLAWYIYDATGNPTWLVASCVMNGSSCTGTLYGTTGPSFGATFNSSLVRSSVAGTITVNFIDANHALVSYTASGVTSTEIITRQIF